jgi:hypothetical protein
MELLATVHWIAAHEAATDAETAAKRVYGWSDRKRMFTPQHIEVAWRTLSEQGWMKEAR